MAQETVREAVAVFHDEKSLQAAVDDLLIGGFDRSQMSLLASQRAIEDKLGHLYDKVAELEDDADVPRVAYAGSDSRAEAKGAAVGVLGYVGAVAAVGAIVASGGTVAAALVGAALAGGAGGMVGAALARFIDRHHAEYLHRQLDHGGILLWVRTQDSEHETRACAILNRHADDDVHVHDLPDVAYDFEGGVSRDLSFMKRLGL